MRVLPLLLATALVAGCSCQRTPTAEEAPAQQAAASTPAHAGAPAGTTDEEQTTAAADAQAARAGIGNGAASTVHAYLQALLAGGAASDRFWTGGKPAPHPDDAGLRSALGDTTALRIFTRQPVALDRETPAHAVEVPVELRLSDAGGTRNFKGWYRLRRTLDGEGWELTSASLQPQLK